MKNQSGKVLFFLIIFVVILFAIFMITTGGKYESKNIIISDNNKIYSIGDTIKIDGFEITLNKFNTKSKGDIIDDYSVVDDPQWIAVYFTYKNISNDDKDIDRNIRIINGNGEYISSSTVYYKVWEGTLLENSKLASGGSKTGYVPFVNSVKDNPKDVKVEVSYDSNFSKEKTITFQLK